jgi:hypothetical protein
MDSWVIGIGAMKCASTWVYEVLRAHPDVCMSKIKELNYFTKNYDHGDAWYSKHFLNCSERAFRGEFSATYLYDKNAARRISEFAPNAKIVVCVRNPIDRAISNYKHLIRVGNIDRGMGFLDALKVSSGLVEKGLYAKYLEQFLLHFPESSIVIVIAEETEKDPERVVKDIYRRIGLSTDFLPTVTTERVHKGSVPRILWMEVARVKLYRYLASRGYGTVVQWIKRSGLPEIYRSFNSSQNNNEQISMQNRLNVARYFSEDVHNLKKMTGLSFPDWKEFVEKPGVSGCPETHA